MKLLALNICSSSLLGDNKSLLKSPVIATLFVGKLWRFNIKPVYIGRGPWSLKLVTSVNIKQVYVRFPVLFNLVSS